MSRILFRAALFATVLATMLEGSSHSMQLHAAAPPKLSDIDTAALIAETERLLPTVARVGERLRFECAIVYLTLRDRPVEARRRFDEILAEIEAADAEYARGTEGTDDDLDQHTARAQVGEWMGRTGLREAAYRQLLVADRLRLDASGGISWPQDCSDQVGRFAVLGFDSDARRILGRFGEEMDAFGRVDATCNAALEARRNGDQDRAAAWRDSALEEFARAKTFHYSGTYPCVNMLARLGDERKLVEVFAKLARSDIKPDEYLALHTCYLRTLMTTGREAEARAIVERFEKLPRNENTAGFHCQLLVTIGERDRAAAVNRAQPMSKSFPNDEKYRRHAVARTFRSLAMQSLSAGDLATARRFYREHVEIRAEEPLRSFRGSPEEEPEFLREQRFGDAVFALECGEIGALLKLAKEEPVTDRHHAEFVCRCNLATVLELERPHQLAPPNPFLGKYWHRGFRVRL